MTISESNNKTKYIGQYKIVSTLATSGYSNVYLVEDTKDLNKQYALKAIKDASEKYKIQNEINIHQKISAHKNVLKLEKIIKMSNHYFFLFEYSNEHDLEKQIEISGKFDEQKILKVAKDMICVLKYAHSLNIIHNDIKPSNILSKKDVYYLCDWGISVDKKTEETLHIRSDEIYVAPEVFSGHFGRNCDIYSLGCTLYYLAMGKKIYDIDDKCTYSYIMYAHCCLDVDVSKIKSEKLKYLILNMTKKNPEDRINLDDIQKVLTDKTSLVYNETSVDYETYKNKNCFELYDKLIKKNILFAYNNLAFLYEITKEKKDINKAMSLYQYAAKHGMAKAMYNLAMCYYNGEDIKKDDNNAFYWFRQASLKKHEKAQYYLATYYERGLVIKKDINKAAQLYKVSAYAGYRKSYDKLKYLQKKYK